jgi:hypothetical protein
MSVWDALSSVADDVLDVVEDVGEGIGNAAASLFEGAAPLAGILVSGGALFIAGAGFLAPAYLSGAGAAAALIRHRPMEPEERSFAERVFGNTLPPNERIVLTNLSGLKGAKFVCPTVHGQILVNLGPTCYDHPTTYQDDKYPAPGKVFIHELAHVWQITHDTYLPRVCERIGGEFTGASYIPPANLRYPWPALSLEQEATVVDEWFAPSTRGPRGTAQSEQHPYFPYIRDVIRAGDYPTQINGVPIYGAICVKWRRLGALAGFLAAPLAPEESATDGTGRMQRFVGGVIVWHPQTGAFSIRGAILARWLAIGAARYGFPITDELGAPDGIGRFNHFKPLLWQGAPDASIYWTPATQAVEIFGDIRRYWAEAGWERGRLGYPLAPEEPAGSGRQQRFAGGLLLWTPDGKIEQRAPEPFIGTFPTGSIPTPVTLYAISDAGELMWRAFRSNVAGTPPTWHGPRECGSGWANFRQVLPAGGAAIYALRSDGSVRWYRHDGFNDGSPVWLGGHEVNTGWHIFERVVPGGHGVLYGIQPDGTLRWYRDFDFLGGSGGVNIRGGMSIGSGWTMFTHVFTAGKGVLYGVESDGSLYWYRHYGFGDGSVGWSHRTKVGGGWGEFVTVFGAGEGVIFALTRDGTLLRYEHRGWETGGGMDTWTEAQAVASGLKNVRSMFALMPVDAKWRL